MAIYILELQIRGVMGIIQRLFFLFLNKNIRRDLSLEPSLTVLMMGHNICFKVVALLFYVHGKHLRSCRDGQLT